MSCGAGFTDNRCYEQTTGISRTVAPRNAGETAP